MKDDYFIILVFISFVLCTVYEIYNWNTPYEIIRYGANGQGYSTGEYTTNAAEFKKAIVWICVFIGIFLISWLYDKISNKK